MRWSEFVVGAGHCAMGLHIINYSPAVKGTNVLVNEHGEGDDGTTSLVISASQGLVECWPLYSDAKTLIFGCAAPCVLHVPCRCQRW